MAQHRICQNHYIWTAITPARGHFVRCRKWAKVQRNGGLWYCPQCAETLSTVRQLIEDYDVVLRDAREASTWGERNQEILRIALSKLDQGHIEMFRAALVGALLPRVNPEQFIKAVQTAEFVNGGKHGTR